MVAVSSCMVSLGFVSSFVVAWRQVEAGMALVFVVSPAGLVILRSNFMQVVSLGTVVHLRQVVHDFMLVLVFVVVDRLAVTVLVHGFDVSLVLEISLSLVMVFLKKGVCNVFLEALLGCVVEVMGLQVGKCLVKFAHEDLVVGLSEVGVVVATELVVSVHHVADGAHHPLNTVHGADSVSITVHNGNGSVGNVLDGDIGGNSVLLALEVRLSILLEASLNSHLEEVRKGASRDGLLSPHSLLIAPLAAQMSAHFRLELLPVKTVETVESNHVNLIYHVVVVVVAHRSLKHVHLSARGQHHSTA